MKTRLVKRHQIDPKKAAKEPLQRLRQNARSTVMPVSMAHAMSALLTEQKRVNRSRLQRFRNAWELAVDETPGLSEGAKAAEVRSIGKTGEVLVHVISPALAHELGVVYREALLAKLRELLHGKDSVSNLVVKTHGRRK